MDHPSTPPNIPHIRIENENDIVKYYDLQKVLGQGAFGVVHLAVDRSTNARYACKALKKSSGSVSSYEQQEREVGILKKLNHVNICQLFAVYESSKSIALVMELCEGGELIDYVKEHKEEMSDSVVRDIVTQLITAVTYLHRNRIVHRDIKPENILLKSKNEIVIKMADFGLACFTDGIYQVDNIAGTPLYMAPEIVQKLGYNHACDIWSIGVMLYLLLCKYQRNSEAMLHEMIVKGKIEYPDFLWQNIDPRGLLLSYYSKTIDRNDFKI
jgi:serine/threonine kinase 33